MRHLVLLLALFPLLPRCGHRVLAGDGFEDADRSENDGECGEAVPPGEPACSSDGWCWLNPLPHGNSQYGVWFFDGSHGWAVGDLGTIIVFDGREWLKQESGVRQDLRDVWGTDPCHVWAVGAGGTILFFDGSRWVAQESRTVEDLHAVHGSGSEDVWAAGAGGAIVHFDGTGWAPMESWTEEPIMGIWVHDPDHVWMTFSTLGHADGGISYYDGSGWRNQYGDSYYNFGRIFGTGMDSIWAVAEHGSEGAVFRFNGSEWTRKMTAPSHDRPLGVWAGSSDSAWVTSSQGNIFLVEEGSWSIVDSGAPWSNHPGWSGARRELYDIHGKGESDVWAVGFSGLIAHHDAAGWHSYGNPSGDFLTRIQVVDGSHIWMLGTSYREDLSGYEGSILFHDGRSWLEQHRTSGRLNDLWVFGEDNAWAAGDRGIFSGDRDLLLHFDGSSWSEINSAASGSVEALWGWDASDLWAAGGGSLIMHYDGSAWAVQMEDPLASVSFHDIWGSDPEHVWAVGDEGTIYFFDGNGWSLQPADSGTLPLLAVWGADSTHVWAAGSACDADFLNSVILSFDGVSWRTDLRSTRDCLTSLWGFNERHVYAFGGGVYRFDGLEWVLQEGIPGLSVFGTDEAHLWAAGWDGEMVFHDGTSWSPRDSGTRNVLAALGGDGEGGMWVSGAGGTILFNESPD